MSTKIDSLVGPALIWAAIRAEGHAPHISCTGVGYRSDHGSWVFPSYDAHEAVDLVTAHWIGIERPSKGQNPPSWTAVANFNGEPKGRQPVWVVSSTHPDFGVAVTRCFVKSRFGEEMEIPDDILALCAEGATT